MRSPSAVETRTNGVNGIQRPVADVTVSAPTRRQILATLGAVGSAGLAGCTGGQAPQDSDTEPTDEQPAADDLQRLWETETRTEYEQNHHKIGVTETGDGTVIGIPLSELPETAGCGLVALDTEGAVRWEQMLPKAVCDPHSIGDVATGVIEETPVLLVATIEGETIAYEAASGEQLFAANLIETIPYSGPALVPEGPEGETRVVVMDNTANVVSARLDGTVDWTHDAGGVGYPAPVVEDVDGDGEMEIVIATDEADGWVTALALDGSVLWETRFESGGRGLVELPQGDRSDVAVSTWKGEVAAIDGRNGDIRWRGMYATRGLLGDYDQDHLYSTEGDGVVNAIDRSDGTLAWSTDSLPSSNPANAPSVGENDDVVAALTYDGAFGILDPDNGTVELGHKLDAESFSSPQLLDLTGNGHDDAVVLFGDGHVEGFRLPH